MTSDPEEPSLDPIPTKEPLLGCVSTQEPSLYPVAINEPSLDVISTEEPTTLVEDNGNVN